MAVTNKTDKSPKPLFGQLSSMTPDHVSAQLYAAAHDLEETLLASGAVPGEDYTRMDLLNLVQPFVLENHHRGLIERHRSVRPGKPMQPLLLGDLPAKDIQRPPGPSD